MSVNKSVNTPNDLTKLTVQQLKALCKEQRVVGYSKLTKSALIQKLTGTNFANVVPPTESSILPPPNASAGANTSQEYSGPQYSDPAAGTKKPQATKKKAVENFPLSGLGARLSIDTVDNTRGNNTTSLNSFNSGSMQAASSSTGKKRAFDEDTSARTSIKKTNTFTRPLATGCSDSSNMSSVNPSSVIFKVPAVPNRAQVTPQAISTASPGILRTGRSQGISEGKTQLLSKASSKRFKPLIVKRVESSTGSQVVENPPARLVACAEHPTIAISLEYYLDFPLSDPVTLGPITLPPSLAQRRRVPRWAIILSALPDNDAIRQTIQVSRMFRYAVYLSASHRLKQSFNGRRLAYILHEYPQNMTNLWPYLRMRERELFHRQQAYDNSFLASFFKHQNPISQRLWSSPDNQKQIIIAIRFVLTRLWFLLSIGGHGQEPLMQTYTTVEDVQELVKDEVWSVTVRSSSRNDTFYVLEPTCEVVGHPPTSSNPSSETDRTGDSIPVRADWSAYIAHRLLPPALHDTPPPPLLAYLKWTNYEEYDKGISKVWLRRVLNEGRMGFAKRVVAERYILACVVGNSVSGPWMSSTQMAQEFSGLPTQVDFIKLRSRQVQLFLPAHHHVESLHFTTSDNRALHPALAIVQTPGREYYILKDNGMHVGCEEDGVGEVWMRLLGCNQSGTFL